MDVLRIQRNYLMSTPYSGEKQINEFEKKIQIIEIQGVTENFKWHTNRYDSKLIYLERLHGQFEMLYAILLHEIRKYHVHKSTR